MHEMREMGDIEMDLRLLLMRNARVLRHIGWLAALEEEIFHLVPCIIAIKLVYKCTIPTKKRGRNAICFFFTEKR